MNPAPSYAAPVQPAHKRINDIPTQKTDRKEERDDSRNAR